MNHEIITDEESRSVPIATRPRIRIRSDGWIRHDGNGFPSTLDHRLGVDTIRRSGNAQFLWGLAAPVHSGWHHTGFSSDVIFWRYSDSRRAGGVA